ncbi:hypothetical protein P4U99_01905 [Brevibacillus agri]|uniref:hypothetical protein n=1 Tax=Brevibacillus agri TaxID=51101 RepID=UPI002E22E7FF|nr:hypothetical protein [Brevibacillus agri]MED1655171.1 hypothetical protein [Brevibacillus agri]MED1687863.1 hypothetical protein [Brevibacillus agri]MED1693048.1 hypothetical protein [Brevibacillus agri]MED1698074.1 hypothetical protein [Brevibacillus agri]
MNKKVTLSLLSATVFASMAASAFAAPTQGVYMGGSVDKFYKLDDLFNLSAAAKKQFVVDLNAANPDLDFKNLVFVDFDGKGAKFSEILAAGTLPKAKRDLTKADFEGSYVTVNLDGSNGVSYDPRNDAVDVPTGDLKVESVSAINSTSIKVNFNAALAGTETRDNFTVTNKATGEKQYIKSVTFAEDKKSATVSFYDALKTATTYTVTYKNGDKTASADLNFVKGEVATITAENLTVPAGVATELKYKVLDANGLDITADTVVTIKSSVANSVTGKNITLADGQVAFVEIEATKTDGTVVKSNRVTITGAESAPAEFVEYTVADDAPAEADWTASSFKPTHLVKMGATDKEIYVNVKDQFGKYVTKPTVEFESLNKEVLLVDRTTGALTPLKAGVADVRIKTGNVNKIVSVEVGAAPAATTVTLDKATINVSEKVTAAQAVEVSLKDQFGDLFASSTDVTATVKSGAEFITLDATEKTTTTGKVTFNITAKKAGTALVEFAIKGTDKKASVTVNVQAAGTVSNYVVEGFKAELDKYDANTEDSVDPTKATLSVYGVDSNGTKTGDPVTTNVTYTVKDKKGAVVTGYNGVEITTAIKASDFTADETYTLVVKVGELDVYTQTFTVKDSTAKPVVTQIGGKVSATGNVGEDIFPKLATKYFEASINGKVQDNATVLNMTYVSDNASVIANGTEATQIKTKAQGNATLAVSSIKIDLDGDAVKTTNDQYTVKLNALIDVTVADATAPIVTGVKDKDLTNKDVTPDSADTDIDTTVLTKDSTAVDGYTLGTKLDVEGVYKLVVTDKAGNATTVNFTIDKTAPVVTGVEHEKTDYAADSELTPTTTATDVKTVTLTKDDTPVVGFKLGDKISGSGAYVLTVTDSAGNETVVTFTIKAGA